MGQLRVRTSSLESNASSCATNSVPKEGLYALTMTRSARTRVFSTKWSMMHWPCEPRRRALSATARLAQH